MALDSLLDIKDLEKQKFLDNGSSEVTVRVIDSVANSLVPNVYDYISLSYGYGGLTSAVFKTGGSSGTTVATLTLSYTATGLVSVTKS